MTMLAKLREYFNDWQAKGYAERPYWYDEYIDQKINELTNVELLELIDALEAKP